MVFKRKWNEELIIAHIMAKRGGEPLNALYYATTYPDLYAAAQRIFGSWRYAIEACGIEYTKVRKYRQWSKTRVVEEIKSLAKRREPLNSIHVQNHRKALYMASLKRFKGWSDAMRSAGFDYTKIRLRRSMAKAQVKDAILELWAEGFDLAYPNMRKKRQWLLATAMKKLGHGSWDNARKACGIKVNFRLKGDKRKAAISKAFEAAMEVASKKAAAKKKTAKAAPKKAASARKAIKAVVKKPVKPTKPLAVKAVVKKTVKPVVKKGLK